MNKRFFFGVIFSIFYCSQIQSESFSDFDRYQGVYTKEYLNKRLETYLKKDKELEDYYTLNDDALSIYSSDENKKLNKPEYVLQLAKSPLQQNLNPKKIPLVGARIAIDPGHFGGDLAKLEQRWIYISKNDAINQPEISFNEGTLTLLTAKKLKSLLEKAGATVLLTKEQSGLGVYDVLFTDWIKEFNNEKKQSLTEIFRGYYNPLDLRARASKINALLPDLTIMIHYNAYDDRDPITQENRLSSPNYNMAFVGGGFCKGEIKEFINRYHFLRLLLNDDIDKSILLSTEIMNQMTKQTQVPLVSDQLNIDYLRKASIKVGPGIYARNLTLTRLVKGPLCYGETFCQDNAEEAIRLNDKGLIIDGIAGPQRIEQVAQAYFKGIVSFLRKQEIGNE